MDNTMTVTDEDINELRSKINEQKKLQEYERLKKDLLDITFQANHTLTEFDSGMKQVDTERVLSSSHKKNLSELFIARLIKMCSVRPVVGNIIALVLAVISLTSLHKFLNGSEFEPLLSSFIMIAGGIQVLKSASRSLVLPLCAILVGAIIIPLITGHHLFLGHSKDFYEGIFVVGLIGLAISVFSID